MRLILLFVASLLALLELVASQLRGAPPISDPYVNTCWAETPGNQWVRRGIHLRQRGDCQQGFICDGSEIKPFRAPCREPSYMSVHTGTCSMPNVYAYVYGSFNCSAEEDDVNLDYDRLMEKRIQICEPLRRRALDDPDLTELYAGDPDDCQLMFKCPLVATHDDWLHRCGPGMRFQEGEEGPCVPDTDGCTFRRGRK